MPTNERYALGVVCPVFVGRGAELTVLTSAFETATTRKPSTALIGGEAGGGKSRLVAEFATSISGRALVLTGGCVEVSAGGLPYAPFTAILRELVRSRGAGDIAALVSPGGVGELAGLLPQLGPAPSPDHAELARARLFEQVLRLLEVLAEQRPVVLVVEDIHWADHATGDLLNFLARNMRDVPVLLVVTFRSEEVEHSPLLPLLAGLGRADGVTRVELARLSRDEVGAQLAGLLGRPPGVALTEVVYERGGGIPLFTEALVNQDGAVQTGLPLALRDFLRAVVKGLPEPTIQVLRVAAVGGQRIGHALLAAVTGMDEAAFTTALRPALTGNVLLADVDGYTYRHELFREAVLADVLSSERARAHRSYAEVLDAAPLLSMEGTVSVELALHWRGAHEDTPALTSAWRAVSNAGATLAYAQRLRMLEQVLELWPRVLDASQLLGATSPRSSSSRRKPPVCMFPTSWANSAPRHASKPPPPRTDTT